MESEDGIQQSKRHRVFLRDSERKEMWCKLAYLRVFPVTDKLPGEECWLVIRRNEGETETKYQFSNAPIRGYIGWNHHMAMVFMAMLFLLEMQDKWELKAPLLTISDVREIFEVIMPKGDG